MSRSIRVLAAILAAAGAASLARAASHSQQIGPIEVDAYWLKAQETLSVVDSLQQADPATVHSSLEAQAIGWEAIKQVKLGSGTIAPVDSSYLVGLLRADPADLDVLHNYLRMLLDENQNLQVPLSSSKGPITEYSKVLSAILARKEFNWETATSNPVQQWLNRLLQRFVDWLNGILPSLGTGGSPVIQGVVGLVGTLVLALILAYILRGLSSSMSDEAAWKDNDEDSLGIVSAEVAARHAEETARLGDYRSAVRWLYLSSLLILEERGLLRYDRTRTNREYLRSVAHLPELSVILRDVIDVFDRVWYGIAPISEADFMRYAARVADLRRLE